MAAATSHEIAKLQELDASLGALCAKLPPNIAASVAPHHADFTARVAESVNNKAINWANILQIIMTIISVIGPLLNPTPVPVPPPATPANG